MSDEFNPYHKWLGIPLSEQPADYYRLLGIALFESDPDVITGASDQRMQFLRTMQTGKRGKLVDKLLNEIANAKVCLLNKEKKAAYDQKLRGKTASAKQTTQKPLFQADAEPVSRRRGGSSKSSRRNSKEENKPNQRPIGLIIGGGIVATLLLIGVFLLLSGRAKKQEISRQAAIVEKQAVEKEKAEAEAQRQELKVARARAEAAERKLKEQAETAASRAQAQKESERRANKEAQRKAKQETARKAKEKAERRAKIESARQSRERASREVSSQKSAHQLLTARGLTLIQGTWRFFPLETEWFQLQSLSQVPPAQDHAWTAAFVEQYQRKMFNEFYRRAGFTPPSPFDSPAARSAPAHNRTPSNIDSVWMRFMLTHHPGIDAKVFGFAKGSPQPFLARAAAEAQVQQVMYRAHSNSRRSPQTTSLSETARKARSQAILKQINIAYQQLDADREIQEALPILGQRLGDPLIDLTLIQPVAPSTASNPVLNEEFTDTKTEGRVPTKQNQKTITREQQAKAIQILKREGLTKGSEGWIPKELGDRLKRLEKEADFLQQKGLTPEQEKEIENFMVKYYENKYNEWKKLNTIGLARAAKQRFEPGTVLLPTDISRQHQYLKNHLLEFTERGVPPKLSPDDVMQENARVAAIQFFSKNNARYTQQADVQYKKKKKQIKTMERKIRMRIRILQEESEVQDALKTLDSQFDPRFLPAKK